jgi:hypothetical protein
VVQRVQEILEQLLDWDHVFIFGRRHGLLPFFYIRLIKIAEAKVPGQELIRLKNHYQENAARNVLLNEELGRLLQALSEANIEAIPYKGPALAVFAYGNLAYRRFLDLDIMVRKADVWRAKEVLVAAGYLPATAWTGSQEELLLRTQHNLQLTREDGRLLVELHWEVASGLFAKSMQAEALWERLELMNLNNRRVKTLAPEDLLLALCVHGSKHLWERLTWVCDVAELLRSHPNIDWETVWERAETGENQRMLSLGLRLAKRLFAAPLPDKIRTRIESDSSLTALVVETCNRVFQRGDEQTVSINENLQFNLKVREGWRSRLRYFRLMFRPTDADVGSIALPAGLSFGYYLLRPFRFLRNRRHQRDLGSES